MKIKIFLICTMLIMLNSPGLSLAVDKWEFIIAPYALVPYIDGDASVGRVEGAELDVGPKDIVENLDLGAMIQLEAHHESGYGISLAYNFMDLGGGATGPSGMVSLDADIYHCVLEGYAIYRVKTGRGTLDYYGGVRWWDMDVELDVNGSKIVENTSDWVDPVVGVRWIPQITDSWHMILKW